MTASQAGGDSVPQASAPREREQAPAFSAADVLTVIRVPLAVAFVAWPDPVGRLLVLAGAAVTDLLDGRVARRFGASRLGAFLDPVADKLFVGAAFLVVLLSGALTPLEIIGVLLRDLLAAVAFVVTLVSGRPSAIQARLGGKVVTVGQLVTLLLFLVDSPYLRPMAWATAAVGLYAIWDYHRVAPRAAHRLDR